MHGGRLIKSKLNKLQAKYYGIQSISVSMGYLSDAAYHDGKPVAMIAAIQEYGAPRAPGGPIPPRPTFRPNISENRAKWSAKLATLIRGKIEPVQAMGIIGEIMAGDLRKQIIKLRLPALSKVTLMIRHMKDFDPDLIMSFTMVLWARMMVKAGMSPGKVNTKPLEDTKHMLHSISYRVDVK